MSDAAQGPLIAVQDLHKIFQVGDQTVPAVQGIDLEIDRGEYVAIMGSSGSGKSTLMNMLGCLDTATKGTYHLNGTEVSTLTDDELAEIRNREIGFVFQTFNLLPRSTAAQNVELPLIYSDAVDPDQQAIDALCRVGLEDRLDHYPSQLSYIESFEFEHHRIGLVDQPLDNLISRRN